MPWQCLRNPTSSGKIPDFHTGSGMGEPPFLSCTFEAVHISLTLDVISLDVHISLTLHKQVSIFCQGHYPAAPTASGTQQGAASRKCIKTNQQERRDLWANSLLLNYLYFIISSKSLAGYWCSSIIEEFPRSLASFA